MFRSMLLLSLFCVAASGATEDFTAWTEVDPATYYEVSAGSVVATAIHRDMAGYVYYDFGAGYFEDVDVKFVWTPGAMNRTDALCHIGLVTFSNTLGDWHSIGQGGGTGARAFTAFQGRVTGGYYLGLWHEATMTIDKTNDSGVYVSVGTPYYCRLTKDHDGGANSTGQWTMTIATSNYADSGGTLIDTLTLDVPSGEQSAFRYALVCQSRVNSSSAPTSSGTISNLEFVEEGEPPEVAADPSPADDATLVALPVTLTWAESEGALNYDVYFALASGELAFVGNVDANEYEPNCFSGTEYQWRIDANNASGSTEGNVWTFTTALAKVTTPDPAHNETNVSVDQILSWVESDGATDYDVYVGLIGGSLSLLGNVTDELYDPVLNYSQGYQWRIDANNASTTTTGDIWQFYTEAEPVVEPNEPEPQPEPTEGWQRSRQWRRTPAWQKRETGLEGWRRR